VLIGGTSNLIDRIIYNSAIDYLPFFGIARWNVADLLIYVGITGLIINVQFST